MAKMQNIETLLGEIGIEIPEDKREEFRVKLHENYKTVVDYEKLENNVETWKKRAEDAENTLKGFEGVDIATIQSELAAWKQKAEEAEKNATAQIYKRDFDDALKSELENVKFTSEAAKRYVESQIRDSDIKLRDGKLLGLSDLIEQIRKEDASAFVDEHREELEANKAKFTTVEKHGGVLGTGRSLKDMSLDERIKLKTNNPEYYNSLRKDN